MSKLEVSYQGKPVDIFDVAALLPGPDATSGASINAMAPPIGLPRGTKKTSGYLVWEQERNRHTPALEALEEPEAFVSADDTDPAGSDQSVTIDPVPNTPGTKRRTVRIDDRLWLAAQAKAEERGENLSEVLRKALERYVTKR